MAEAQHRDEPSGRRVSPRLVVWAIVALLAVIFVVQNTNQTTVSFLMFDVQTGTWLALVIAVALGMLLGWLLPRLRNRDEA